MLISTLTTIKFEESNTTHKQIVAKLKILELTMNEKILIKFILNLSLSEYSSFQITYNTILKNGMYQIAQQLGSRKNKV